MATTSAPRRAAAVPSRPRRTDCRAALGTGRVAGTPLGAGLIAWHPQAQDMPPWHRECQDTHGCAIFRVRRSWRIKVPSGCRHTTVTPQGPGHCGMAPGCPAPQGPKGWCGASARGQHQPPPSCPPCRSGAGDSATCTCLCKGHVEPGPTAQVCVCARMTGGAGHHGVRVCM